jgi:two-component sensor histidine kinase
MQMLQSLLYSAASQSQSLEAKQILADAATRISAMAAAQRVLYGTSDATRFSAQEFLSSVCETAKQSFPPDVTIVCEAATGEISNDSAMPLALILNELLTNAVKHGLKDSKGTIRAGLADQDGSFTLYVEDEGPGFDLEFVLPKSSGLRLVQGLARQLRGQFQVTRTPASRCTLRFS